MTKKYFTQSQCKHCGKIYTKQRDSNRSFCDNQCRVNFRIANKKVIIRPSKTCPKCHTIHNKIGTFCSRSCANGHIVTDKHKSKLMDTINTKLTIKNQFGEHPRKSALPKNIGKIRQFNYVGPYTKIYLCTCKYSGKKWYSPTVKTVHPDLGRTRKEYSYSCRFQFGISSFPDWFTDASELINKYGWYSTPGSRKGIKNTNGISRDHLYSITDGWTNNVPPELIRHPANCELVPHQQNQSKYYTSKITLDELYQRIRQFNLLYGLPCTDLNGD